MCGCCSKTQPRPFISDKGHNPLRYTDPTGEAAFVILIALVALGVGATGGVPLSRGTPG